MLANASPEEILSYPDLINQYTLRIFVNSYLNYFVKHATKFLSVFKINIIFVKTKSGIRL